MIRIDGQSLTIEEVVAAARERESVTLAPQAKLAIERSRKALEDLVQEGDIAYGIKTGFGQLENVAIPEGAVRDLQRNLVRSHAVGVGDPLKKEQVRAALLLRANSL